MRHREERSEVAIRRRVLDGLAALAMTLILLIATPATAQTFPALTGRVVDQADLLRPEQELDLTSKLAALEAQSGRQFVVATVRSLEGRTIEDYGYRLGRHWRIGDEKRDDGVILLVAPNEKKVRIETGYGARVVLTDAVSSVIIRNSILPRFRQGDFAGGVMAGADQIITMLTLPPEEARRRAAQAGAQEAQRREASPGLMPIIFWMLIILFVVMPLVHSAAGRRYRGRRHRGWGGPVILWGPGLGGGGGFGGGSDFGGGFSGGGGSFGGGGASGSW